MQILLLEDEKCHLHEQLAQDDDRIDDLEKSNCQLQDSLNAVRGSLDTACSDLRLKLREVDTLKVPGRQTT